jgi:CarD family transcriptional regulator
MDVSERDGGTYLSIQIFHSKLMLMLPESMAGSKGVRRVLRKGDVGPLLGVLRSDGEELEQNPQHRVRIITDKAKTGKSNNLAELIRDLTARESGGAKLNAGEARTLQIAREHLASELMLVRDIDLVQAMALIDGALAEGPAAAAH